jgi:hypothetical protein
MISAPGARLRGAGGEPPQLRLRGLTCPANPAGGRTPSAPINRCFYISLRPCGPRTKKRVSFYKWIPEFLVTVIKNRLGPEQNTV